MKILAPINNPKEVKIIIQAGADELYCGVNPLQWSKKYTNVASSNRREWSAANLSSFNHLKQVVEIAHKDNIPVYLTLNALYTDEQYPLIEKFLEQVYRFKIGALIVTDLGLLLKLKQMQTDIKLCISTGGTTFNNLAVEFYKSLGAKRIILPRHLTVEEIGDITSSNPDMEFEVFIMNSGCKNIDGFCTFHHGVKERLHSYKWNLPKKLNFDRQLLKLVQFLPNSFRDKIYNVPFGIDSACLLNYKIDMLDKDKNLSSKEKKLLSGKIKRAFSLQYGIDSCGGCALVELIHMNVSGVKIVGRNYSTKKKLKDIKFIKTVLGMINTGEYTSTEKLRLQIKKIYKKIYHIPCRELCYYQT